ncbi:MAG TPA: ABC transporter ATP-binding protein [Pseudonocardiaceae bacterium]|nr:ABC transporter ATP-binding protein [Pseudonocardiaceae bacterium]
MSQTEQRDTSRTDETRDLAVELRNVGVAYGGGRGRRSDRFVAVADASFTVGRNELVAIIGPSGCGKSSLLSAIAGLVPFTGDLRVIGEPVNGPGVNRGFVFQAASLLPWRTVLRNTTYGLELRGVSRADRTRAAEQALALVGLTEFQDSYPKQLSGGMQQRVNFARALAADPPVLLMDEPFAALDAQTREHLQAELLSIWELTDKSGIFVTHQIDEAVLLADRVVVLSRGPRSSVARIIDVPLPRPRPADVRSDPKFLRTVAELRSLLDAFYQEG